jgi:ACDE family multidrug resistance protein
LANTVLTPNIPDILADLGRTNASAGILVASGPLPGAFAAPVLGVLADRFGRKRVLIPCLILFALAGIAAGLAPNFELLLLARVAQGLGSAGLINLSIVLIGDHWTGIERTKLIGYNSAVLTFALAVVPSISGLIAEAYSWRWSLAIGGLALPIAIIGLFVLADSRPAVQTQLADQLRGAAEAVKTPVIRSVLVIGFLLFVVIFGVFLTTLPVHLEELGYGPAARGLILSGPALGATLAAVNLSRVRSTFGLRLLLVGSISLIALAAVGIAITSSVGIIAGAMLVYGLGDGSLIPALQDVATSATSDVQRGAVMAAWVTAVRLGQAAGPLLAAAIFSHYSTTAAMIAGSVGFAITGLVIYFGPLNEESVAAAVAATSTSAS